MGRQMACNLMRRVLSSIADRGRTFFAGVSCASIEQLCQDLVSERGEASGTAIAREITDRYRELTPEQRLRFFERLLDQTWLADPVTILTLAQKYQATPGPAELARLFSAAEPRRQELFRRINSSPRGTETIVNMRRDLLALLGEHPCLEKSCQRAMITSQYFGSNSISRARRPVFSQATRVVPEPPNGSSTRLPRLLLFITARSTRTTGFIVG